MKSTRRMTRRNALQLGAAAAAIPALSAVRPRRAKAAQPIVVWWTQGFYRAEDQAVKDAMAKWEKQTGNPVDLTIINGPDLVTKIIAAMHVGDVPDLVHSVTGNLFLVPQAVWNDQLLDVSDVVETQKANLTKTALDSSYYYNNAQKKRSYFTVPIKCATLMEEAWRPLINEAGFQDSDIPTTQDKYYEFFQVVQDKLRSKGKRIFGLGYPMATKEADSGNLFHAFLNAYGGDGIVTPDGKLHIDDAQVQKAAITALERLTTPFKKGYVPPGAINWGDVDNNNAFYAKQIVMTPNATISIAVAQQEKQEQYMTEIITQAVPLGNDGKPVKSVVGVSPCFIPKGAKNVDGAKALLRDFITPQNLNTYLKEARGRWEPIMPVNLKEDPFWLDPADPHRAVGARAVFERPTMPWWQTYNPAYAQVASEQLWTQAEAEITQNGLTPEAAAEKAATRIKSIFSRFVIA
ncbi:MAG: ABC transporter substrate-binding protein [Acetobacteraceae bacterium]